MVICSECGTRVPPKTLLCTKCGAPVDATGVGPPRHARESLPWWAFAAALAALAAAGFAAYVLFR